MTVCLKLVLLRNEALFLLPASVCVRAHVCVRVC